MKKLSDEILNKFIDGELNAAETGEIKEVLENSVDDKIRLDALIAVHKGLKEVKELRVSPNFTAAVMKRLNQSMRFQKADRRFVAFISAILLSAVLGVIGYSFYLLMPQAVDSQAVNQNVNIYTNGLVEVFNKFLKAFTSANISILGSIFSLFLLISGYFFFESQRNAKKRMGKFN